jgi:ABC-type glycerol-3-phosphate transport system substrate-binding protein
VLFYDLSKYFKNSSDQDSYYPGVLDAGKVNGKQYLVPLGFRLPVLYTSEETLADQNITLKDGYTYNDLFSAIVKNSERLQNDSDHATVLENYNDDLSSVTSLLFGKSDVAYWLEAIGKSTVDLKSHKVTASKSDFILAANLQKAIIKDKSKASLLLKSYIDDSANLPDHFSFLFLSATQFVEYSPIYIYTQYFYQKKTLRPLAIPNDNKNNTGIVYLYGAVNANTKNPNAAYAMLHSIMNCREFVGSSTMLNQYPTFVTESLSAEADRF